MKIIIKFLDFQENNADTDAEAMFTAYRVSSQLVLYLSFEKKKFGNMFTSTCAVQEVHTHIMLQITTYVHHVLSCSPCILLQSALQLYPPGYLGRY